MTNRYTDYRDFVVRTAVEMSDFVERTDKVGEGAFPRYLNFSPMVKNHWADLYRLFRPFQFALLEPGSSAVASFGNCFPLKWDTPMEQLPEEGLEWSLPLAVQQALAGVQPNILCAFQIIVRPDLLNRGLSYCTVEAMLDVARRNRLGALIAPVRPNRREHHPEMPFDDYAKWRRPDGLPVDDWLRVHVRLGGNIVGVCHRAMQVTGSFDDWKTWTGVSFDGDRPPVPPRGLVPLEVDRLSRIARYIEPNIWVVHHTG